MLPINVVWIDGEEDFVTSMKSHLLDGDCLQHLVDGASHLLDQIVWTTADLVCLELQLQSKSGLDLVNDIRQRKSGIPVVLVTTSPDRDILVKAINLGINGLLEKPVSADGLRECLNRYRVDGYDLKMCRDRKAIFSQNKWVDLTSTEYKIIETLKSAARRLTRSELQGAVWPNSSISENNLDTHLTNLKRKIPELNSVLNVKRGLGYYLDNKRHA